MSVELNFIAVAVAALINYGLGALWYSPVLFANVWMAAQSRSKEELSKGMTWVFVGGAVVSILEAFGVGYVAALAQPGGLVEALQLAFFLWIGFLLPIASYALVYEGQHKNAFLLLVSYQLVAFVAMAATISLWP